MPLSKPAPERPDLDELLRRAKDYKMTPAELDAQARSWVRGNVGLSRPDLTTAQMDAAIDAAIGPSPYVRITELEAALAAAEASALTAKRDGMIEAAGIAEGAAPQAYAVARDYYGQGAYDSAKAIAHTIRTRAASLTGEGAGWRSMDSAPKDGTEVLVWDRDAGSAYVAFWEESWQRWRIGRSNDRRVDELDCVTHWRTVHPPLPADAPHTETRGDG